MTPFRIVASLLAGGLFLQGGLCLAEPVAQAEPQLGRLFLTPEWRSALERQRQHNIQQTRTLEGDTVRLDGVVARSSGKSTVWINHQPQTESARDSGVIASTSRRQPGRATVFTGAEPPVDLQVGVTLNQATGEKSGGLASGEIRVRPARQK
ncbi:MAG: hypothetical protein AB1443_02390 [Pseudomonadota bacterium]